MTRSARILCTIAMLTLLIANESESGKPTGSVTTISPNDRWGQQLTRAVDYLRSIGMSAEATQLESCLANGQIQVATLGAGCLGYSPKHRAPVIIGKIFLEPLPKADGRGGWDIDNIDLYANMLTVVSTFIHEKIHADKHTWGDRFDAHWRSGDWNEVEAWTAQLRFIDAVINKLIEQSFREVDEFELRKILERIQVLLDFKIGKLKTYDMAQYGPMIKDPDTGRPWQPDLEKFREGVDKEIDELPSPHVESLKSLFEVENETLERYAESIAGRPDSLRLEAAHLILKIAGAAIKAIGGEELLDGSVGFWIDVAAVESPPTDGGQSVFYEVYYIDGATVVVPLDFAPDMRYYDYGVVLKADLYAQFLTGTRPVIITPTTARLEPGGRIFLENGDLVVTSVEKKSWGQLKVDFIDQR